MLLTILTAVDEWQAEIQSERGVGVSEAKRAAVKRHSDDCAGPHVCGSPSDHRVAGPFGYGSDPSRPSERADLIIDAYHEVGTYLGAARLLNNRGVPTRTGASWSDMAVKKIVDRHRKGVPSWA
jgi:hypothetical protein